jgi:aminocarboxymuconate-semialdehyde decarboxylase
MLTIDSHAHLIVPAAVERLAVELPEFAPIFVDRPQGRFLVYPSGRESGPLPLGMTDPDARRSDMKRQRIDVQFLSPSPPQFAYSLPAEAAVLHSRIVNDETIALAHSDPDHYRALATLPLQNVTAALDELERVSDDPLVVGVELGATINGINLDDESLESVWAALATNGSFVLIHSAPPETPQLSKHFMRNLVGNPSDSTLAIGSLIFGGVLERNPDLRVCFVHGGGFAPYQIGRWDRGWALRDGLKRHIPNPPSSYLRQVYFDTLTHDRDSLAFLGARVGWDHVLLGSDYCFDMASDDPVSEVIALGLNPSDERAVLGGTLEALLGIDDRSTPSPSRSGG